MTTATPLKTTLSPKHLRALRRIKAMASVLEDEREEILLEAGLTAGRTYDVNLETGEVTEVDE